MRIGLGVFLTFIFTVLIAETEEKKGGRGRSSVWGRRRTMGRGKRPYQGLEGIQKRQLPPYIIAAGGKRRKREVEGDFVLDVQKRAVQVMCPSKRGKRSLDPGCLKTSKRQFQPHIHGMNVEKRQFQPHIHGMEVEKRQFQPYIHGVEKRQFQPHIHGVEKRQFQPHIHGMEKRQFQPHIHGVEKRQFQPHIHGVEKRQFQPHIHGVEKRQFQPHIHGLAKRAVKFGATMVEKRQFQPHIHGSESKIAKRSTWRPEDYTQAEMKKRAWFNPGVKIVGKRSASFEAQDAIQRQEESPRSRRSVQDRASSDSWFNPKQHSSIKVIGKRSAANAALGQRSKRAAEIIILPWNTRDKRLKWVNRGKRIPWINRGKRIPWVNRG